MSYYKGMNDKTQRMALQALYCCFSLPGWLAVAMLRGQTLSRPRWQARIRRQPAPAPVEKPRLPRRFSA